jgi:predicted secreted hydrolase
MYDTRRNADMTEKKHLLSDILKQSSKFLQPRIWKVQKALHDTLLWVDSKNYPKLIPAESSGSELQKFQNPSKALVSWADKQQQTWHLTGLLHSKSQREFGISMKFLQRRTHEDRLGVLPAHWLVPQWHSAELLVSDPKNAVPSKAHRVFRKNTALGHKGFFSQDILHAETGGWFLQSHDFQNFKLSASHRQLSLYLDLTAMKPLTYLGQAGYLQKEGVASEGAFHCIVPRLKATGHLSLDGRLHFVDGLFRLEHEKKSLLEEPRRLKPPTDWLSISFDDGNELIFSQNADQKNEAHWIDPEGNYRYFVSSEIRDEVMQYWTSPKTGLRYPLKRQLRIAPLDLTIELEPTSLNQETHSVILGSNWSGHITCHGSKRGRGFAMYPRLKLNHNLTKDFSRLNPLMPLRKLF